MRTWSERSIKNLTGCHPDLQRVMNVALQISPVDFGVIDGLRTKAEQVKNVEAGASQTLDSRHLQGCAVDVIAAVTKGSDPWKFDLYIKISAAVKAAAAIEQVPVVWGGDWKSLKDGGHFELKKSAYPNGVEYTPGLTPDQCPPKYWTPGLTAAKPPVFTMVPTSDLTEAERNQLVSDWERKMQMIQDEMMKHWMTRPQGLKV